MLSTAPAGGGLAGGTTTDWNTGSGWVKDFERSIASSLLNLSNHFWSSCSSLLSVVSLEALAYGFLVMLFLLFLISWDRTLQTWQSLFFTQGSLPFPLSRQWAQ